MAKLPPAAARMPLEDALTAVWLTSPLERVTRGRLAALASLRQINAGEVLLREGEPADTLGILLGRRVSRAKHYLDLSVERLDRAVSR